MKRFAPKLFPWLFALLCPVLVARGQGPTNAEAINRVISGVKGRHELTSITPEYRNEALRLVAEEANKVATELALRESSPITETNVLSAYITPPRLAEGIGAIGNVTTSNYTYFVSVGRKLSFLTRTGLDRQYARLRKECLRPMSELNTNAAYGLATQWLARASMDVQALNRDCVVRVMAFAPEGPNGAHFVPVYWVYWTRLPEGHGSVATVELFAPSNELLDLRVEEPQYILRKPVELPKSRR